jgi:transcriptional regulator of acetoin/glycerol metabolism
MKNTIRPERKNAAGRMSATKAGSREEDERMMLLGALSANSGNISKAAQALGISRESFQRSLRQYGIVDAL